MAEFLKDIVEEIQRVLTFLEEKGNLTLVIIHEETDISYSQLSRFKSGKSTPKMRTARKVLIKLEQTYEKLLEGMPRKKLSPEMEAIAKQLQIKEGETRIYNHIVLEQILKEIQANREERKQLMELLRKLELKGKAAGDGSSSGSQEDAEPASGDTGS